MSTIAIRIEGTGYATQSEGQRVRVGFFTTRIMQASELAVDIPAEIRQALEAELEQAGIVPLPNAALSFVESFEWEEDRVPEGFTFYEERGIMVLIRRFLSFLRR